MKTDKIQLILISLACFLPVCQVVIFAGTEELVEIITLGIYLKEKCNRKFPAITPTHHTQAQ